jgi:hypothetical protein
MRNTQRVLEWGMMAALVVLGMVVGTKLPARGGTNTDLLGLLERAERRYADVNDYTAILLRRERIGGTLRPQETILLKFQIPYKVYMKWLEGRGKGREGLYVAGAHDGRFLVHEPRGIRSLVTAALDPSDSRVLEESRHPVTDVGIGRLLEIIGENTRRGAREGVLRLVDRGVAVVGGQWVQQVEGILPRNPRAGYYCYRVLLSFDEENHLPIRVVVYDWRNRVAEDYTYTQLRLNPGLSDQDFDPDNPDYDLAGWRITISK